MTKERLERLREEVDRIAESGDGVAFGKLLDDLAKELRAEKESPNAWRGWLLLAEKRRWYECICGRENERQRSVGEAARLKAAEI